MVVRATKEFVFFSTNSSNEKLVTDIKDYLQNKDQYKDKSISHMIVKSPCFCML